MLKSMKNDRAGWNVVFKALIGEMREDDARFEIITRIANVTKPEDLKAAAEEMVKTFGRIDVACCNAGVCRLGNFLEMSEADRDFHIDVNIKGVWNTCKAVIPNMLENGGGNIVIASSVTGDIVADPGESAYALSKAALVGLTKALAIEFAGKNIRVNCSQLGYARTPMAESIAKQSNPDDPESALADMAKGILPDCPARPCRGLKNTDLKDGLMKSLPVMIRLSTSPTRSRFNWHLSA